MSFENDEKMFEWAQRNLRIIKDTSRYEDRIVLQVQNPYYYGLWDEISSVSVDYERKREQNDY